MAITTEQPRRHRLTVDDYYRMGEVGILAPDARVELIEGEILDMAPPGNLHAGTVDQLVALLGRAVAERALLRVQSPISVDRYSEPQPDLALLRPRTDFYKSSHPRPEDVWLVIEVADSSLRYDRDVKVGLYARSGVSEVWLVDLQEGQLTRYREPTPSSYRRIDRPNLTLPLEIDALSGVRIDLRTLFE
jgi:Uma2 family endonuclease